jgi:pimeloyl-ACP methyl ester carboxylesterase
VVSTKDVQQLSAKFNESEWVYFKGGSGPDLVWLHGLWGEPGWGAHHDALAENNTVYAPLLPGYGGSSLPRSGVNMEDVGVMLIEFIDALKLHKPVLVGNSLGAWAAAEAAIFRPDHIQALALIDPLGIALDWTAMPNVFYIDPDKLPGVFFGDPGAAAVADYLPPTAEWDERFIRNREASVRLAFTPYLHNPRLAERLRFIDVPTAVIWGDKDQLVTVNHAREWESRIPNAKTFIIEGAGHLAHVEKPEAVLKALTGFLDGLPSRKAS